MEDKECTRCQATRPADEFYKRSNGRLNPWCKSCYRAWHRNRYTTQVDDEPRQCSWCGSSYQPQQRRPSTYCSRSCKDKARDAASAARREAAKPARSCVWCGADMLQRMRADAKFCSAACNGAAHNGTRKMWRRLGTPKGDIPLVSRTYLVSRDGATCHLCKRRLRLETKHPDPGYASIDHVQPLSEGGTNDLANLRLAHLVCNLRKRASAMGEQLSLIG